MPSRARLALAVGGGYLLGRTKKLKLALSVGSLVAGRQASGPNGLMAATLDAVRKNPEFDALREQLMGAGRTAALAAATRGLERTTQRVSAGVDKIAGGGASGEGDQEEPEQEQEQEQPQDEHDEAQEQRGETEDDERGESKDQRRFEAPGGKQRYRPRDDDSESDGQSKQRPPARKARAQSNGSQSKGTQSKGSQSKAAQSNGSGGERPARRRATPARSGGRNG